MAALQLIKDLIAKHANTVLIFSKTYCPYCSEVKKLFDKKKVAHIDYELDEMPNGDELQQALSTITKVSTVPQVFVYGTFTGGCTDNQALDKQGKLDKMLAKQQE
eukprot:ANDGO_02601.mRNA.1 Glutaredoxin-C5